MNYSKNDIEKLFDDERLGRVAIFKALLTIFSLQTADEQLNETTSHLNGVGFTAFDAEILTSLANQFIERRRISTKQYQLLSKRIRKYSRQLAKVANGNLEVDVTSIFPKTNPSTWVY